MYGLHVADARIRIAFLWTGCSFPFASSSSVLPRVMPRSICCAFLVPGWKASGSACKPSPSSASFPVRPCFPCGVCPHRIPVCWPFPFWASPPGFGAASFPCVSPGPCIWMRRVPAVFIAAGPSPIWVRWGPWSPSCSLEKRPSPSWHCSGSAKKCSTSGSPFLWHAVSGAAKVRSVCAPSGLILCCCSS